MARLSTLGHGACWEGHPSGDVAKLAEKAAGSGERQSRVPLGRQGKGIFIGSLERVASPFPGGSCGWRMAWASVHKTAAETQALAFTRHFPIVTTQNPHCDLARYLLLQIGKLRFKDCALAEATRQRQNLNQDVTTPVLCHSHHRVCIGRV